MRKMEIWREDLIEKLVDRERAIGYLQAILDDYYIYGNPAIVLRALETVVKAQGGKVLSNAETPLIDALGTILNALGYQLSIQPLERENSNPELATENEMPL